MNETVQTVDTLARDLAGQLEVIARDTYPVFAEQWFLRQTAYAAIGWGFAVAGIICLIAAPFVWRRISESGMDSCDQQGAHVAVISVAAAAALAMFFGFGFGTAEFADGLAPAVHLIEQAMK